MTDQYPLMLDGEFPFAVFSGCGTYRYFLRRQWGKRGTTPIYLVWIALNPSTADHEKNDPTVTRMINFSKKWGYDGLKLLNIFALRSTDPGGLRKIDDPIGPDNDWWIKTVAGARGQDVVCAWGVHGIFMSRGANVMNDLLLSSGANVSVLGWTKSGCPKHPLYLASSTQLQRVRA